MWRLEYTIKYYTTIEEHLIASRRDFDGLESFQTNSQNFDEMQLPEIAI